MDVVENLDAREQESDLNDDGGNSLLELYEEENRLMLQQVYNEQPLLLYSVFAMDSLNVFLDKSEKKRYGIDFILHMIENCCRVYEEEYKNIIRKKKYKLKEYQYVDRIDKLTKLTSTTIKYMAMNPQYLVEVKRNKGISYKGKKYLPEKTLVEKNVIDYNTYENRYLLSFLMMMVEECMNISYSLEKWKTEFIKLKGMRNPQYKIDEYTFCEERCTDSIEKLAEYKKRLLRIARMYRSGLGLIEAKNIPSSVTAPNVTAIFRQLPEYNVFYKKVYVPWFQAGVNLVDPKDAKISVEEFLNAVPKDYTSFELYIVSEWVKFFCEEGYTLDEKSIKYSGLKGKEKRYSEDAYEYIFLKENEEDDLEKITLYYSPSVYLPSKKGLLKGRFPKGNIDDHLYRNRTQVSSKDEDDIKDYSGKHYEPDFVIKYEKGNVIRYLISDAKHKKADEVKKKDLQDLEYKYLNSLSTYSNPEQQLDIEIAGLCAVYAYGKESDNRVLDCSLNSQDDPIIEMLYMNKMYGDDSWKEQFASIIERMKNYSRRPAFLKYLIRHNGEDAIKHICFASGEYIDETIFPDQEVPEAWENSSNSKKLWWIKNKLSNISDTSDAEWTVEQLES